MKETCEVAICERTRTGRQRWCKRHYARWLQTGDVQADVPIARYTRIEGTPAERFWGRVDRTGDCWTWQSTVNSDGYGVWSVKESGRTRTWGAHRYSWIITNGPVPDGLHVLHQCDNPPCVNPSHLFLGTPLTNARDKVSKGRMRRGDFRGEKHGGAKLTAERVVELRARVAAGERQSDLAREYGVARQTVCNVIRGRLWSHVA